MGLRISATDKLGVSEIFMGFVPKKCDYYP